MSASLAPECNDLKERYDTCFLKWYSEKFLRNKASTLPPSPSTSPALPSTPPSTTTSSISTTSPSSSVGSLGGDGGSGARQKTTTECDSLFDAYSKCLWRALEQRGVAGMVMEARKEAEETDAEHMRAPHVPGRK